MNKWTVWKNSEGELFFNSNCHGDHTVGEVVCGFECAFVGSWDDCLKFIEKDRPQ